MEQKNNKGLIWLTVLLIILFIGLISLVVFNTMLKQNVKTNNDNTTTTTTTENKVNVKDENINEKILNLNVYEKVFECYNNNKRECVLYNKDNINILAKLEKSEEQFSDFYLKIYVNNKMIIGENNEIDEDVLSDFDMDIQIIDENHFLLKEYWMNSSENYLYNIDGNKIVDFTKFGIIENSKGKKDGLLYIDFENNTFYIKATLSFADWGYSYLCETYSDNDLIEVVKIIDYLGNGKLAKEKIESEKKLSELLKENNYTYTKCEDVKKYDPYFTN